MKSKTPKARNKLLLIFMALLIVLGTTAFLGKKFGGILATKVLGTIFSRLTGGDLNIEKEDGKVVFQGNEGNFSFDQGGKLPDSFPKDFPIYTQANLKGSWSAKGDSGDGISVIWESESGITQVADYYKEKLPLVDWKITSSFNSENSSTFSFEKEGKNGFLGITRTDNLTTISVTVRIK